MRYAIVSDIHANLQAWEAVRADIAGQKVDATLCLGDIVGYGPMPAAVLDSVREHVDNIVMGNHDAAVGERMDTALFGERALQSLQWTRARLDDDGIRFLGELPLRIEADNFVAAHAELVDPEAFGYLDNPTDARLNFACSSHPLLFVGHTHVPEMYALRESCNTVQKSACKDFVLEAGVRYLVNAGSVGDPRDGTAQACYCIYDDILQTVAFRKLPFDLEGFQMDLRTQGVEDRPAFLYAAGDTVAPAQEDWAMEMAPRSPPPVQADSRHTNQPGRRLAASPSRAPRLRVLRKGARATERAGPQSDAAAKATEEKRSPRRQAQERRRQKIRESIQKKKQRNRPGQRAGWEPEES